LSAFVLCVFLLARVWTEDEESWGGICTLISRAVRPVSLIFSFHHVLVGRVRTRPVVANWLFGGFRAYLAQFRRHRRRWLTPSVLFVCLLLLDIRSLEPRFESLFFRNGEANRRRKNINEFVYTVVDPEFFLQFVYQMRSVFLIIFFPSRCTLVQFFFLSKKVSSR